MNDVSYGVRLRSQRHAPRRSPPLLRTALVALAAALLFAKVGSAGEEWKKEKPYRDLLASEAKELRELLRSAVKEDYRRQAWYFASRLLAADPKNAEAQAALDRWTDAELQEGMVPKPAWADRRTKKLQEIGDQYARLAETLGQANVPPEDFYSVNIRSRAYGTTYEAAIAGFEQAGFAWLGTFGDVEEKPLEQMLGPLLREITFPPEFDDEYLKRKVLWPEAKVAQLDAWRFTTDAKPMEAMRMLALLHALEAFVVDSLGSEMKKPPEPTNLLLFLEPKTYDRVGEALLEKGEMPDFKETSSYASPWRHLLLVLWRHRTNPWLGEDAVLLGAAGPLLARHHLTPGVLSSVNGRGAWLLDGLAGACHGFVRGEKGEPDGIDPARCGLLAIARALRDQNDLVSWDDLLGMDREKAEALPRRAVKVAFGGGTFEAKDVDVAEVQATALVLGLWKAEGGKGGRRLARLLHDLYQRDSLPDLDKTLGWKKGRAFEEAAKAIDAATGK